MSKDANKRDSMTSTSTKPDPFPGEEETKVEDQVDEQEEARRRQELRGQAEVIQAAEALVRLSREREIEEEGNDGDVDGDEEGDDEGDGDGADESETLEDDGRRTE